jgi:hypothetical protein
VSPAAQVRRRKAQEITLIYAVMTCLLIVVVAQFVLLLVSVESFLGGHRDVLFPATLASGACFAGATWLIRYILPLSGKGPARSRR